MNKFERQLWLLIVFLSMLLLVVFVFLLVFAGDDIAWAFGEIWNLLSPFMPLLCLGFGFWLGFRTASSQVGKVMNTVGMAIPGFVANSKVQMEMARLERAKQVDQRHSPARSPAAPPVPYQPPMVNPYQDVVNGYQNTLRSRQFEYLQESDYTDGGEGF